MSTCRLHPRECGANSSSCLLLRSYPDATGLPNHSDREPPLCISRVSITLPGLEDPTFRNTNRHFTTAPQWRSFLHSKCAAIKLLHRRLYYGLCMDARRTYVSYLTLKLTISSFIMFNLYIESYREL